MAWAVYIDYGSGWVDLTNYSGSNLILDTLKLTEKLHDKKYKPAMSSASFSAILDTTLATNLLAAVDDIKCEIYQDSEIWFRGFARPVTKYKNNGNDDTIDFEIFDYGYFLDKALQGNLTYEDKKICDTGNPANSIIHLLLEEAAYPSSYIGITLDINITIPVITFNKGENFSEILANILWDYHHVYNIRTDGTIVVYDWAPASIIPVKEFDESNIIAELELSNEDNDYDQAKVIYNEFATVTGATVYNRKQEGGLQYNGEFARAWNNDVYWPSSPGQFDYNIDDDGKKKLLRVRNQSLSFNVVRRKDGLFGLSTYGTGSASVESAAHSRSYSILQFLITDPGDTGFPFYRNLGDELEEITIKGTLDFFIEGNKETSIYSTSNSKGRLQEYKATYIYNDDDAKALADAIITTLEHGKRAFSFSSETKADIGDNVTISNTKLNISIDARIISKKIDKKNNVDIWRYEAISVSALQTQVGSIVSGGYYLGPTAERLGDMAKIISAGLSPAGEALQPISSNILNNEYEPGASGLYITATEMGYYDETKEEYTAYIKADGTFKFMGNADNFLEWNGDQLLLQGDAQSANFETGVSGWQILNDGNAELNDVTVRGTVYASAGSFTGTIMAAEGQIGGWDISAHSIISENDRFAIRSDALAQEIRDAFGTIKMITGYMGNAPAGWLNKDGDQLGENDYGQYISGGNYVVADGALFENGDYHIAHDAAYLVLSPLGTEIIRLGSLGAGDIGYDIGGMKYASALTGGGDSDDTFKDTLTGGGGASTAMDALVGGGESLYGAKGLLYSMADGRLYLAGDAVIDGTITTPKLAAQAVTAVKIDVADLFAQDITFTNTIQSDGFVSGSGGHGVKLDAINDTYEFHGIIYSVNSSISGALSSPNILSLTDHMFSEITWSAGDLMDFSKLNEIFVAGPGAMWIDATVNGEHCEWAEVYSDGDSVAYANFYRGSPLSNYSLIGSENASQSHFALNVTVHNIAASTLLIRASNVSVNGKITPQHASMSVLRSSVTHVGTLYEVSGTMHGITLNNTDLYDFLNDMLEIADDHRITYSGLRVFGSVVFGGTIYKVYRLLEAYPPEDANPILVCYSNTTSYPEIRITVGEGSDSCTYSLTA